MRIISGKLKGKSINYIKDSITRPLKDSVKENIFNVLNHSNQIEINIKEANILDLYSGIGSFGLECISREANKVTFIEQNKNTFNVLKKNLVALSVIDQAMIINDKIENFINKINKEKYDIFFLDPPFVDKDFIKILQSIKKNKLYKKKHIVIIHREKNANDNLDGLVNTFITKQYGRSKIIFGVFN